MKQFEKWYGELPIREDAEDFTLETQAKYRKGWIAALEWTLSNETSICYSLPVVLVDLIEKEMKED